MTQTEMGTMRISRLLPKMALPLILAQLVNGLYNIVDRIYLGHIPGAGAAILTGVGVAFPIILLITAFAQLIGSGGGPLASMRLGQNRKDLAEEIVSTSAAALLVLSVFLMVFFYIFKKPLLYLFGASDVTIVSANEYVSVYLIGTPFVLLTLGLNPFISSQGMTTKSMLTVVIGAALNIVLDPVFIFVMGMGARGAATATIISQCVSAIYVLKILSGKESALKLRAKDIKIRKKVLLPIVALGVSPFIMVSTEAAISFVFTSRLQMLGGDLAVGTMTILNSVLNFANMPIHGFNQAVVPVVSYNFGAGNKKRVVDTYRFALASEFIFTLLVSVFCIKFPRLILSLFSSSEELVSFGAPFMKYFFAGYAIFGLQFASQNSFMGLGQAKLSMFFAIFRKIILLIPLVYILSSTALGVAGVFLAESIADSVSAVCTVTVFLLNFRKILDKGAPKAN